MTEQVAPSAELLSPAPTETPVPVIEAPPSGAPPSVDIEAVVAEVRRRILPDLMPEVQRRTDTYVMGRLRGASTEALAKSLGVTVEKLEQAIRDQVLDEVVAERLNPPSPQPPSQPKETLQERTSTLLARLVRELKISIDAADIDALSKKRSYFGDQDWLDEVEAHVRAQAQAARVGPGAATREAGRTPPPPPPDLQAKYDAEKAKLRRGDVSGHVALKLKYRKLGLDV